MDVDWLTDDLLTEILLRIHPAIRIYQCKTVCKRWNSVISSAYFGHHAHHRRIPPPSMLILNPGGADSRYLLNPVGGKNFASIFDGQSFYLLASCNDLLLLSPTQIKDDQGTYYLWNPFTEQISQLPPILNIKIPQGYVNSSFGLVSKFSDESHVFRVIRLPHIKEPVYLFDMYSSETGTWTQHEICPEICAEGLGALVNTTPFYFGGKIYWKGNHHQIVALDPFNLDNMTCTIAYPPVHVQLPSNNSSNLRTLNSCVFGALEGRLRLFDLQQHATPGQLWLSQDKCLLSVWELNDSTCEYQWSLVDQVYLCELVSLDSRVYLSKGSYIYPLAMDTKDKEVIYIQHGNQYLSCNMKTRELQLANTVKVATNVKVGSGTSYFRYYFQLGLPWIPTPVYDALKLNAC